MTYVDNKISPKEFQIFPREKTRDLPPICLFAFFLTWTFCVFIILDLVLHSRLLPCNLLSISTMVKSVDPDTLNAALGVWEDLKKIDGYERVAGSAVMKL